MKKYAIVIEKAENNYSAYVPDIPGCIATADTLEEVKREMKSAIEIYFEASKDFRQPIPAEPTTLCDYVDVEV